MNDPTPLTPSGAGLPSRRERLDALFPDASAEPRRPGRRLNRAVAAIAVVVALVAVGFLATGAFASDAPSYRTAVVTKRDVDAVHTEVGTIQPVSQATVAFPVGGTVASVGVAVGDTVTAGQQLAALDTASLTATLHEKEASLAQAQLTLSRALNGESVSAIGGTGGSGSAGTVAATTSAGSTSTAVLMSAALTATSTDPKIAQAQQAVLAAQQAVDHALAAADTASASATSLCAAAGVGTSDPGSADALAACQAALADVQKAQSDVTAAQKQLASASEALDSLLEQQAAAPSGGTGGSGAAGNAPSSGSAPSGSGSGGSSPSSADLANYQQQVDAAAAQVTVAEQSLGQAVIVSPIAGTVVAVTLTAGADVSAASTTDHVVVEGPGGYEATTSVSVDEIADVAVGQPATVRVDGQIKALTGKVVAISTAPDSTDSSTTTTYRVTVGLDGTDAAVRNGATATISIVTSAAKAALAVPTSAVTTTGSRSTVTVLDGSTTRSAPVTLGVVGDTWTAVTRGISPGDVVVLATVSKPLPSSATSSSSTTQGTNGIPNFPGGGVFPGFGRGGNR